MIVHFTHVCIRERERHWSRAFELLYARGLEDGVGGKRVDVHFHAYAAVAIWRSDLRVDLLGYPKLLDSLSKRENPEVPPLT